MGGRPLVLVARREVLERARDRSFQISLAVTLLIVSGAAILAGALGGDDAEEFRVGFAGREPPAIVNAARAAAPEFDARVEPRRVRSAAAGRAELRDEQLDALLLADETLLTKDDPPENLDRLFQLATRQVRGAKLLRSRGVGENAARRALDPPPLRLKALESDEREDERRGVAMAASFLLYGQLITFGLWVAMGVVEEKASRVVEVLLASVKPRDLLAGKIIGLGLLGLLQLVLAGAVGVALAELSGAIGLDRTTLETLAVVLVWFVFGYALYACLYAMTGVLVSRQEDLQSATTPLTFAIVLAFLVAFPALDEPSGTIARVASIVPFTSPIVMPVRVALGEADAIEIIASLALLAGSVAVLVPLGARIYEGAILRTGRPLKLLEAWRAARA